MFLFAQQRRRVSSISIEFLGKGRIRPRERGEGKTNLLDLVELFVFEVEFVFERLDTDVEIDFLFFRSKSLLPFDDHLLFLFDSFLQLLFLLLTFLRRRGRREVDWGGSTTNLQGLLSRPKPIVSFEEFRSVLVDVSLQLVVVRSDLTEFLAEIGVHLYEGDKQTNGRRGRGERGEIERWI